MTTVGVDQPVNNRQRAIPYKLSTHLMSALWCLIQLYKTLRLLVGCFQQPTRQESISAHCYRHLGPGLFLFREKNYLFLSTLLSQMGELCLQEQRYRWSGPEVSACCRTCNSSLIFNKWQIFLPETKVLASHLWKQRSVWMKGGSRRCGWPALTAVLLSEEMMIQGIYLVGFLL